MGCCSSVSMKANAATDRTPVYYYCPRTVEEREPLSITPVTSSAVTPGLLIDRNANLSFAGAYPEPSAPLQYDVEMEIFQTLPGNFGNCGMKTSQRPTGSALVGGTVVEDTSGCLKGSSEGKSEVVDKQNSLELVEVEPSKLSIHYPLFMEEDEEDICPTCLEEYDQENPKIITKCEHHFHLSCIFEWMERSETCPICNKIMKFDLGSEEQ